MSEELTLHEKALQSLDLAIKRLEFANRMLQGLTIIAKLDATADSTNTDKNLREAGNVARSLIAQAQGGGA